MARESRVRGPGSALSEFLRERGIDANQISSRHRTRQAAALAQGGNDTGVRMGSAADYTSTAVVAGPSSAPTPAMNLEANASGKTKKRKKRDLDPFAFGGGPVPGQIDYCQKCNCRFTVTAYTKQSGDGLLCTPCGKNEASVEKKAAKGKATAKRVRTQQMSLLLDGESLGVKSLREIAINVLAKNIDDVEVEGALAYGSRNSDRLCQLLSRNRALDDRTLKLFLDPGIHRLNLYDCAKVSTAALQSVGLIVPTLRYLCLRFAANLNDDVLEYYATQLKDLRGIELGGAFLITKKAYCTFFELRGSNLEELTISDTFRVDKDVVECIVDNCPSLRELRLQSIIGVDNECVRLLTGLTNLEVLEISRPGTTIDDSAIIDLLNNVGAGLKELNLSKCSGLTGKTLYAIGECCSRLRRLSLTEAHGVDDTSVQELFELWTHNPGLKQLNLSRIGPLGEEALSAILTHSGKTIEFLNLNSSGITSSAWQVWGAEEEHHPKMLKSLDVGFVRSVNDEVVEKICRLSPDLQEIKVWGNNRITETVQVPENIRIVGREADLHYSNLLALECN